MRKCGFLTLDSLYGFVCDDDLAIVPLAERGWDVEMVSWKDENVDWDSFDVVVVRSPWDYQSNPKRFIEVLEKIDASEAVLLNDLELMKWNMSKIYLRELREKGVPIVPTIFTEELTSTLVDQAFRRFNARQVVMKPQVGANADDTFRLRATETFERWDELKTCFTLRPFMVQPFVSSVVEEGEYSLFYFNGGYSHCILKTPKEDDFRVQEEHGGTVISDAPEPGMLEVANMAIAALPTIPLYTRVDLVRAHKDQFWLMELELIEPALYFRFDKHSASFFARALDEKMQTLV